MMTNGSSNQAGFASGNEHPEAPRQIKPPPKPAKWKLDRYAAAAESIRRYDARDEIRVHIVPCPSPCCADTTFALTLDDIAALRRGEKICEDCLTHGGKSRRLRYYENRCPEAFRVGETRTDPACLENLARLTEVWGEKGLPKKSVYIFGETGARKSRTAWELIRRRVMPSTVEFRVVNGGEFRAAMLDALGDYARINQIKSRLSDVPLLVFDDFAQDVLTDTMIGDLWSILDNRFRHAETRRTVFLSNLPPRDFARKIGNDYVAKSMVRRIREFAEILEFKRERQLLLNF